MESSGTQSREEKGGSSINGGGPGHSPSPPLTVGGSPQSPAALFFFSCSRSPAAEEFAIFVFAFLPPVNAYESSLNCSPNMH